MKLIPQKSSVNPQRTLHLNEETGQLYTCFHGVPEGDYGFAEDFAKQIVLELTPEQRAYAGSPERGEYRGFAALHDLMDANMLLPYADEEAEEGDGAQFIREFWEDWRPVSSDIVTRWWEMMESAVTERLIKLSEE